jgi:hypothetical protein
VHVVRRPSCALEASEFCWLDAGCDVH